MGTRAGPPAPGPVRHWARAFFLVVLATLALIAVSMMLSIIGG